MAGADALAADLADAILDGAPIDWSSVESNPASIDQRLLEQLKLLARVADLHRALPVWEPDEHWGHLRVLERLGAGAHGMVYRAWDTRLDREVALKLLPAAVDDAAGGSTSIIEEGRLLARVRHPNVVTIYGAEQIADRVGLWMELIAGKTLEQLLEGGRTFTPSEARHIAVELCHAMGAVHGAGLLHRDIKAHNVMLADDGRVVLMDFGTGRELDDRSMSPAAGTPLYLAPEIFAGAPASVRSDVYSAGVLLYRLLTGKYPVGGRNLRALRLAHQRGGRSALGLARPDVPTRLCEVVERAIEAHPDSRYQSAEAMARDLAPVEPGRWHGGWRYGAGAAAILLLTVWLVPGVRDHLSRGTNGPASRSDAPVSREIRLDAVPFTSYTGREAEPTFSPDASRVAFTWDGENEDNFDIYVKPIGAEQPLRLTSDRARDGSPAWSPDGSRIAFLRDKPRGGSVVRLIAPAGGPERTIGEVQGLAHQGLSWSPDGRSLAVVDRSSPKERLGMFVLDVVSGVKKRITASTHIDILPAFSPDGRTLAFNRTILPGGPFVHVVPVAGGEPRVLVPTSFPRGRLAWIPGGEEILFTAAPRARDGGHPGPASSAGRAGASSLWRVPATGGQARLLAGSENAGDVAVSTDGHRLVYSQGTMDWDIWRLDLRRGPTAADAQTRFIASTRIDANPQFSPDGERVAFTSHRSGQPEIWVVDRHGRYPLRLTSFGGHGNVGAPRWSPDGKTIACDFGAEGGNGINVDIYVISALGGPPRRLTTSPAIDATPSWSRDGRWIYFASNRSGQWQVWKVPSNGQDAGSARQVTRGGGFAAIESVDGRHVYFTRDLTGTLDPQSALWRIPVEGGEEVVVVEGYRSSHVSWDLTADGLYFVDEDPSSSGTSWVVRFKGFNGGHATEVARLRHPPFLGGPAISVSSDGRWLLSTQSQEESDLMLVETFR